MIELVGNGIAQHRLYDKRRDFNFDVVQFTHRKSCIPQIYFSHNVRSQGIRIFRANSTGHGFIADMKVIKNIFIRRGMSIDEFNKAYKKLENYPQLE